MSYDGFYGELSTRGTVNDLLSQANNIKSSIEASEAAVAADTSEVGWKHAEVTLKADQVQTDANLVSMRAQEVTLNAAQVQTNTTLVETKAQEVTLNADQVSTKAQEVTLKAAQVQTNTTLVETKAQEVTLNAAQVQTDANLVSTKAQEVQDNSEYVAEIVAYYSPVVIDDAAGLGTTNVTWSADKSSKELDGKASNTDPRFTDAREWVATTITQAEAEAGTATTRRSWTAQRVRQAANSTITAQNGIANGIASLDGNAKIPLSQLSDSIIGQVEYMGLWAASTNTPTLPTTPAQKGQYYVVNTSGTQFGHSFAVGDWIISNGASWDKVDNTDAVSSVNGRTGNVTGLAESTDTRFTDSREWTGTTISQAEAEGGTSTTRRAFTAQRVRQAIVAWAPATATRWPTWAEVTGKPAMLNPWPVGACYTQYPGTPTPVTLFGGEWQQLFNTEGVFFRTEGGEASGFEGGVQEGDNKSHAHTASTNSTGAHTHTLSGTAASAGGHTHTIPSNKQGGSADHRVDGISARHSSSDGTSTNTTSSEGEHTHTISGTAASEGAHAHTVTVAASGGSEARPKNRTIRVWQRTA